MHNATKFLKVDSIKAETLHSPQVSTIPKSKSTKSPPLSPTRDFLTSQATFQQAGPAKRVPIPNTFVPGVLIMNWLQTESKNAENNF